MTHWFDRLTKDIATAKSSRRSALLALGLGMVGISDAAMGQERFPRRGVRPPPPPFPPRPPLLRGGPPLRQPPLREPVPPVTQPPPVTQKTPVQKQTPRTPPTPAAPGQCVASLDGRHANIELAAQATFQGKPLSLRFTRTRDNFRNTANKVLIQLGNDTLVDARINTSPPGPQMFEGQLRLGSQFPGPKLVTFASANGGIAQGTLDGRRLLPFSGKTAASALRFSDGGTLPAFQPLPPDLGAALQALLSRAQVIGRTCKSTPTPKPPRHAHSDSGHRSGPENDQGCQDCYLGCDVGTVGGIFGDLVSLVTGGPAAFAGAIAGTTLADLWCFNACARGSACCPVQCSANPIQDGLTTPAVTPDCCESGEICLDIHSGICCSQGQVPCSATSCCDPGEVCQKDGGCCSPNRICNNNKDFICCPEGSVCEPDNKHNPNINGAHCCFEGHVSCDGICCSDAKETCKSGKCCLPGHECGDTCCGELANCVDNKFCCEFMQSPCGSTCCNTGDLCVNGACCHPAQSCKLADGSSFCCPPNHICDLANHTCSTTACDPGYVPCAPDPAGPNLCCPHGHSCCAGACCSDPNQTCCQPVHSLGQTNGKFGCNLSSYCLA